MEASHTTIAVNGSKPEAVTKHKKRGKFLWYGESGSWKTLTALKLFSRAYVIDMEQGTDFYRDQFPNHKFVDAITPQEVDECINFLSTEKHEYTVLIIDPITIWHETHRQYWSDVFLVRNRQGKGFKHDFYEMQPRDWQTIGSAERAFLGKLGRLDMNIILTAHETNLYDNSVNSEMMKKIGTTFAGIKKLDYWADTVMQFKKKRGSATWTIDKDRAFGMEQDSSHPVDIEALRATMGVGVDRASVPVKLSTRDQEIDIIHEVNRAGLTTDKLKTSLRKYGVTSIPELTESDAEEILTKLKGLKDGGS